MKKYLPLILIVLLGCICYANIFSNEFVFDDPEVIVKNKSIQDITDIKSILTTNYWHEQANAGLYRPVVFLSYAIDYHFWRDNPRGYHYFNITAHLIVCLLVYFIVLRFTKNAVVSFMSSLLFCAHPVHTEAVTGIVGRAEVFAALFFCLAWILFIRGYLKSFSGQNPHTSAFWGLWFVFSWVSYFLALGSKENSVVLPVVIILTAYYYKKKWDLRELIFILVPYIIVFLIYFIIRWHVIGSIGPTGEEQFFYNRCGSTVLFTMIRVFSWYLKLLVIPTNLLCVYRHWRLSFSFLEWSVVVSLLIDILWVLPAVLFFRAKKAWQFFNLFVFIGLFPVSNIIRIGDIMAERFLYLPSLGFCACFSLLFFQMDKTIKKQAILLPVYLLIIMCFILGTIGRNTQWRDGIIFWQTTLRDIPHSSHGYYNLATAYAEKGLVKQAIGALKMSLKVDPAHHLAREYMAQLYYEAGRYDESIFQCRKLLKTVPARAQVYRWLALSLMRQKKYNEAIQVCQKGIDILKEKSPLYYALYRIYLNMNKPQKALDSALQAISYDMGDVSAYVMAGNCYHRLGRDAEAKSSYIKALRLNSRNMEALDKLAVLYHTEGEYDRAIKLWKQIIKWYPSNDYFWYYIGIAYEHKGDMTNALASWKKVTTPQSYRLKVKERLKQYHQ